MTTGYGWALERDAETWDVAEGATREAAAAYAWAQVDADASLADAEVVYICERKNVDKLAAILPNADRLVEDMEEWAAEDDVATWHDDNLLDHSTLATAALETLLRRALAEWLEHFPGPAVWEAVNVTGHRRPT